MIAGQLSLSLPAERLALLVSVLLLDQREESLFILAPEYTAVEFRQEFLQNIMYC